MMASIPLFWIDLEMTGLDESQDKILEMAVVITDLDFNPLEKYRRVIFQPAEILETMNEWCRKTHGQSGLTAEVARGIPLSQAESETLQLIDRHFPKTEKIVLAGNSIWNDRRFIDRYLPKFAERLHYRMIDVSSFKEIFRRKYNITHEKKDCHRALDDIDESIEELKNYLKLVKPNS